ncbi:WD repeat and FYVE domain-containing protein 2 [Hypsibius exemplaris]|uniref:WD repeat and FYVE domain-containing protein 2 n=1 Tax=Hypsibius exemplaris TaxID=2072580 RepID=A0A1W0X8D2_HYPEX|nr:WD repeat and FYVE domain-containing protein 2 [Hypsibius exemplaris]
MATIRNVGMGMASSSTSSSSNGGGAAKAKADLIYRMDDFPDNVNGASIMAREDGIITISEDRTVRIWQKRDNGKFWPSICQYMPHPATAFAFNQETRKLFVGTESGSITEFIISNDSNRLTQLKDYSGHNKRITALHFALECEWLLSCSRDKTFRWFCSESGRLLGSFTLSAWITALQFDFPSKCAFVGDFSGAISVLRLSESGHQLVTTIRGHASSIRSLAWDSKRQQLFSGGFDSTVVVWDIGGKEGIAYELQAHTGKVTSLHYAASTQQLFSAGEDGIVAIWNMDIKRNETPSWVESDNCQQCNKPFFWNFRMMFDTKTLGQRQHHCRNCGKAVCEACSPNRLTIPLMGFETAVRVCSICYALLKDKDRPSHAVLINVLHAVMSMDLDEMKKRMVTVGQDRVVKVWDVRELFSLKSEQ